MHTPTGGATPCLSMACQGPCCLGRAFGGLCWQRLFVLLPNFICCHATCDCKNAHDLLSGLQTSQPPHTRALERGVNANGREHQQALLKPYSQGAVHLHLIVCARPQPQVSHKTQQVSHSPATPQPSRPSEFPFAFNPCPRMPQDTWYCMAPT